MNRRQHRTRFIPAVINDFRQQVEDAKWHEVTANRQAALESSAPPANDLDEHCIPKSPKRT